MKSVNRRKSLLGKNQSIVLNIFLIFITFIINFSSTSFPATLFDRHIILPKEWKIFDMKKLIIVRSIRGVKY